MKTDANRAKFCCLLLLTLALAACKPGANAGNSGASAQGNEANAEMCRKYSSCGCQSYEDCMKEAAQSPNFDKPGVRECILKSSCESLCLGFPDGCVKEGGGGQPGAGGAGGGQQRSNCSAIRCSRNSDCPSDCYGGCDGVICYSF